MSPRRSVPVVYIRGGTSKALFFHAADIPPAGAARDRFLLRAMGSPDPMQIDGMGGTHIVTSKVAIVSRSEREGVDVDYTFAQVGMRDAIVGYDGNCGNISAGVGGFAIDEGLLEGKEWREGVSLDEKGRTREVRIYNTGTKKVLVSHVPVDEENRSVEEGGFEISGVPGTGAPVLMDYRNVIGAALAASVLPTGNAVDRIKIGDHTIESTICDVANLIVFASAKDFGITGSERPADLDDPQIISRVEELRGKAAQMVGMCKNWINVDEESPMLPMVVLVSPATNPKGHFQSRLWLDKRCHTSMAGTGGICTAACSRVSGSVVNELMDARGLEEKVLNIQHPLGIMPISVETVPSAERNATVPEFKTLSFVRTARRIIEGKIYVPED